MRPLPALSLAAGAVAASLVVWWSTRSPAPAPEVQLPPQAASATPEPELPRPALAPARDSATAAAAQPPAPPRAPGHPPAVVPRSGAWDTIPPSTLRSWPTLAAALEGARPRLDHCFDEETQARYGPRPFSTVGATPPGTGAPVLLLRLEGNASGRLRVVDAPVESRGASEDGLLSCVQEALRGLEVAGPGGPGARHQVRYPVRPLAPQVASQQILAPRVRLRER